MVVGSSKYKEVSLWRIKDEGNFTIVFIVVRKPLKVVFVYENVLGYITLVANKVNWKWQEKEICYVI